MNATDPACDRCEHCGLSNWNCWCAYCENCGLPDHVCDCVMCGSCHAIVDPSDYDVDLDQCRDCIKAQSFEVGHDPLD